MSQESSLILPEGTIVGSYEIIKNIGKGGFGITYKARHIKTGIIRAIKEYFPSDYASRARDGLTIVSHTNNKNGDKDVYSWGLKSFLEEAKTLGEFNYPTIVKIIDYFDANNTAYMVMEYYEGETLKKYLKRNKNKTFSQDEILNIIMPILEGLKEVHSKGYLHRDIAPDNILLRKNYLPVLIDFGSSRNAIGNKSKTLSAIIKPGYSPPEQYTFNSNQNATADIYAVCAVMYEMITKKAPPESTQRQTLVFNGTDDPIIDIVSKYKDKYSKSFLEAIMQGLALKANERTQSVEELQERLVGDISEPPLPEPPKKHTLQDLDDLILIAGSDKIITADEEAMILNKGKSLGLDEKEVKRYISEAIKAYGWEREENTKENTKKAEKNKEDELKNYKIIKKIEQEDIATLYKVQDNDFNYYTLKEYNLLEDIYGEEAKKFILDWLQKISKIKDSSLIEIKNVFVENNKISVLLPYFIDGHRLDKLEKKQLSQEEILAIINPILNVLEKLHSNNIFYGDIGSDNIYINSKNDKQSSSIFVNIVPEYKIMGILYIDVVQNSKQRYMPIEAYVGNFKELTAASDIYSISAIMYEMITGKRPPYAVERQMNINNGEKDPLIFLEKAYKDKYDKAFLQAITKGLSIKKENRQQSIKEFKEWLKNGDPEDKKNEDSTFTIFMIIFMALILIVLFIVTSNN